MKSSNKLTAWLLLVLFLASGCNSENASSAGNDPGGDPGPGNPSSGNQGECGDYSEYRNAYFGDLHVHTSYSFDAYLFGNQMNDPDVAYQFAQGSRIRLNDNARGERYVQLDEPLDFAAVTDHSEYLGEVQICSDQDQGGLVYYDPLCIQFRTSDPTSSIGFLVWGLRLTQPTYGRQHFCALGDCTGAAQSAWEQTTRIADANNQPCAFTTFNAYEYSPSSNGTRQHRNIIFRNSHVPSLPVSYFEAPEPFDLFRKLNAACDEVEGCEYLSIPHNPNLSHGTLLWADPQRFTDPDYVDGLREIARLNPVLEMLQVKGNSECKLWLGTSTDEECEFEQLRSKPLCCDPDNGITEHCVQKTAALPLFQEANCHEVCPGDRAKEGINLNADNSQGCFASHDFVRGAFLKGMAAQREIGFNPARYALIASTDNHNSAAGDVSESGSAESEYGWEGAHGGQDDDPSERFDVLTNVGRIANPGGLAGIWAHENTRDSIFDALQRGEVFATSGTRIRLRFYAGDYPADMCSMPDAAMKEIAYGKGVPMGSDIELDNDGSSPNFVIQVLADEHPLQRTQVVKLWVDDEGRGHEKVFDIDTYAAPASVTEDCQVDFQSPAETRMSACHQWQDPEFDPDLQASYYLRVLEDSSCRWTGYLCASMLEKGELECSTSPDHPCCTEGEAAVKKVIQERAWSSPVWYTPDGLGG